MEFIQTTEKERALLLDALDFKGQLRCHYCGRFTSAKKCGIMPYLKKGDKKRHTTILCDDIFCMIHYIDAEEEHEAKKGRWRKWLRYMRL